MTTVYIVDDNKEVVKALCWLLKPLEFSTKGFNSAQAFLDAYQQTPNCPSCLLLDIRMPLMTGIELLDILKQRDIQVPVIFITGHGDMALAVRAMKNGAFDMFTKPVNNHELIESVNKALRHDKRRLQRQNENACYLEKFSKLTARELEIIPLIIKGQTAKQIAKLLKISPHTTDLHRANILRKLECQSLAGLIHMNYRAQSAGISFAAEDETTY